MNHKSNKWQSKKYFRNIDVILFLFKLFHSIYVKELKTRIHKDHKLLFVDQKASQSGALLNVDAKEDIFQLLPKETIKA